MLWTYVAIYVASYSILVIFRLDSNTFLIYKVGKYIFL